MSNLKRSQSVRVAVSATDWFRFQLLCQDDKTTPRLALALLVRDCLKRGSISVSPKKRRGGILLKP